jgi:LacI family transcriptional regulator
VRTGKTGANGRRQSRQTGKSLSLKELADNLGLAPATVSLVLNASPVAHTISKETRDRIFAAAKRLNYRPNFFARCLRTRRSFTIGVMVPEVSEGYNANVMSGVEEHLLTEGYFYFVASHRFQPDLIDEYSELFLQRSVDGLIVVCAPWHRSLPIPVVTVSCHHDVEGVTRILLDHERAAELALNHLVQLGHQKIAFMKGQEFVPDTEIRWRAIQKTARKMALTISHNLTVQIARNSPSPQLGYEVTERLLVAGEPFTALFAFNDICAIGAIRALHEFGLRVPEDVSVIGFDDIESAAYQHPGLTSVQQPLRKMGNLAAQTVLRRVAGNGTEQQGVSRPIVLEPELIVRGTTGPARQQRRRIRRGQLQYR